MDILAELINLRKKIDKIDAKQFDWERRSSTIERLQHMCHHKLVGVLDSDHTVCEVCGKEMRRAPKGAKRRMIPIAEFINLRNLDGNIVDILF